MDKIIITLREAINVGGSLTKTIEARHVEYFKDGHMVKFEMINGDEGELPIRNVSGVIYKTGEKI
jgi:hypothetical protein